MYELTGKLYPNVTYTASGKPLVTIEVNERVFALQMVDDLNLAEKLTIQIDRFSEKRSNNANKYAWCLIGKIGNKIRQSKEDVYFQMLKRYGQSEMISVLAHIPVGSFVKYFEEAGESTLRGKVFKHYRVYKGSSEFTTQEMSVFIDGIISEAKELNIQTETPEQIAKMKSLWREER